LLRLLNYNGWSGIKRGFEGHLWGVQGFLSPGCFLVKQGMMKRSSRMLFRTFFFLISSTKERYVDAGASPGLRFRFQHLHSECCLGREPGVKIPMQYF
jgi:hypothetical protein